ncbi:MAG: cell division protein FtsZ [Nitrososphaerota archaeon]
MLEEYSFYKPIKIHLIGVGGAGCNTLHRLALNGLSGVYFIAMNTDKQHLDMIRAHKKVLLGKNVTHEKGAGGDPEVGRLAAEESIDEIEQVVSDADIVFISAGLGGGTGTGGAPLIAEVARDKGATVVGVVTLPFNFEGNLRKRIALKGLEKMQQACNTVMVIDNNKLRELYPGYKLLNAFYLADEVVKNMIISITESISKPSLVNLDYADFKTIVEKGRLAAIGIGWASSINRAEEATFNALNCPLLDITYDGVTGAIIHVTGGEDMSLAEAAKPGEIISQLMSDNALVIWGARIDNYYASTIQVSLVLTGVTPSQNISEISQKKNKEEKLKQLEEIDISKKIDEEINMIIQELGVKML